MQQYSWICDLLEEVADFSSKSGFAKTSAALKETQLIAKQEISETQKLGEIESVSIDRLAIVPKYKSN